MATGMNSTHLAAGSTCPPLAKGKLRLYNMRFCPFGERTLLAVLHKELPVEIVNMHLKQKAEWMAGKNPLEKVPILEIDDKIVYESGICNEWLDKMYPTDKPLLPKDPTAAAHQKILDERLSAGIPSFYGLVMSNAETQQTKMDALKKVLADADLLLTADYYGGSSVGWTDLMVWPLFERLGVIDVMKKDVNIMKHLADKHPKLVTYIERMKKVPCVQKAAVGVEIHVELLKGYASNNPQYDALCAKVA